MLYAILAYHDEHVVQSWDETEDQTLMAGLEAAHARVNQIGRLGPAARLGATTLASTLRKPGLVTDGPFTETKEALLGFYVVECASQDEALEAAEALKAANPGAVYEIRPIVLFRPGEAFPLTNAGLELVRPARS